VTDSSNAPIPETMEGLRRQNSAYRSLCATQELRLATQTDFARRCRDAEMTLDSERAANALLTEEIEALRAAGLLLRREAFMLLQNSEGCATNHYGGDSAQFGMPGWLRDSREIVENAGRVFLVSSLPSTAGAR
jgi:hypothetical protein